MIGRREFIALAGGAATIWPLVARAQQSAVPVIGFINSASSKAFASYVAGFLEGLRDFGYVEGQNLAIEYRWAEGHYDRLPALAAELVRRPVSVIVATGGTVSALAAKAATTTIPIVFTTADNPVVAGLVTSLSRPGGNVTGVTFVGAELRPKNLELLHELVPAAAVVGVLVNPNTPSTERQLRDLHNAASNLGKKIYVVNAGTAGEIDAAFATLDQQHIGVLIVGTDPVFNARRDQLVALAMRHKILTVYFLREFTVAGGLMSYGGSLADAYRLAGTYTGRILKGEKPADLPVQQSTKIELVINLKTAKALGITIPRSLLARADEVIE
jgi:ABC-type uncharacterized transport system substrate-binding protein